MGSNQMEHSKSIPLAAGTDRRRGIVFAFGIGLASRIRDMNNTEELHPIEASAASAGFRRDHSNPILH